jgi:hypothetical protein
MVPFADDSYTLFAGAQLKINPIILDLQDFSPRLAAVAAVRCSQVGGQYMLGCVRAPSSHRQYRTVHTIYHILIYLLLHTAADLFCYVILNYRAICMLSSVSDILNL